MIAARRFCKQGIIDMRKAVLPALFVALSISTAQAAQYVVSEARGVGIAVGSVIDPTKPLVLKLGQHLTLISESGQTIHIDGPYQKAPAAEHGVALGAALSGLMTERTVRTAELGTTRGAVPHPPLPQPWLIDATSSGSACLRQGTSVVLWRPVAATPASLTIMPADRSWRAEAHWPAGTPQLPVNGDIGMHGDAAYFVAIDGAESAIAISTVPTVLASDQMRAAWMIDKGCQRQAEALIRQSK
jgi:hypothetical protein